MLKMLNNVERISQLIPKFKQQLIFLEEREKLFQKINDDSISCHDSLSTTYTISKTSASSSTNSQTPPAASINSNSLSTICQPITNISSTISIDDSKSDQSSISTDVSLSFPHVYQVPVLPNALMKDIEDGNLKHFGPHFQCRQILIDAVVHDLIENYSLL